jgi:hypothetical protein
MKEQKKKKKTNFTSSSSSASPYQTTHLDLPTYEVQEA